MTLFCAFALIGAHAHLSAWSSADEPQVRISDTGVVTTVWSVYDDANSDYVIRVNKWAAGSGWSSNATISTTPGISFSPFIDFNASGNGAVIWIALDGSNVMTLFGRTYNNGSWDGGATQISHTGNDVGDYKIQVNDNGDIVVMWQETTSTPTSDIYVMTGSSVSGGWNTSGITKISD